MTIEEILDYITETPGNTNRAVLRSILQSLETGDSVPFNVVGLVLSENDADTIACTCASLVDKIPSVMCTITFPVGGDIELTDWILTGGSTPSEKLTDYYAEAIDHAFPPEVYVAIANYVADNQTTIQTTTITTRYSIYNAKPGLPTTDSEEPVINPDTPLQPPQEEEGGGIPTR